MSFASWVVLCAVSIQLNAQKAAKENRPSFSKQESASSDIGNITYKTYYVRISNSAINASLAQDSIDEVSEWLEPYIGWLDVLFRQAKSGELVVFEDKECVTPYTQNQVNQILIKNIERYMVNDFTLQEVPVNTKIEVLWHQIQLIAFYERWIATADGKLRKEVLSYAPVFEVEDNTIEFPHLKNILFWVKQ